MQNNLDTLRDARESDLVRAAQGGSDRAFEELLRRSRPRLVRIASSILNNPDEVDDAVQNASWKAYEHLSSFRQDASFNTWLTRIVVNQARMRLRELRRARLVSIDDDADDRVSASIQLTDSAPDPERAYGGDELTRALHKEIRRLPAKFRHILLLHVEDRSLQETAKQLNVSLAAAKSRLLRARHHLNERMRNYVESAAVAA